MARIEEFFESRGAEVFHEVSPMADPSLLERLAARGYHPIELSSVLFRPTAGGVASARESAVTVRRTGADEADLWARVAAEGWSSESAELGDFMLGLGQITARSEGSSCFVAELDGRPVAAGGLTTFALLATDLSVLSIRKYSTLDGSFPLDGPEWIDASHLVATPARRPPGSPSWAGPTPRCPVAKARRRSTWRPAATPCSASSPPRTAFRTS